MSDSTAPTAAVASPAALRIRGFDGLRAISVIFVFFEHRLLIVDGGQFGVWMFFLLSGCLIIRILASEREAVERGASTPTQGLKQFYWRRTLRIFPIYYGLLALLGLVSIVHPMLYFSDGSWPWYWVYLTNVQQARLNAFTGDFSHLWTLAIEEQFYLLFAPLVLFAPRARTAAICLAIMVLGLAVKAGLHLSGATQIQIYVSSFVNFYMLAMGGLIGLWSLKGLPAWLGRWPVQAGLLGTFLVMPFALPHHWTLETPWGQLAPIVGAFGLASLMAGQDTWVAGLLELWPARALGRISYGFYLYHDFVPRKALTHLLDKVHIHAFWVLVTAEFTIALTAAILSWLCFERVILRYRHVFDARKPRSAPA